MTSRALSPLTCYDFVMKKLIFITALLCIAVGWYTYTTIMNEKTSLNISYSVNGTELSEQEFLELKGLLVISPEPVSTSNFETAPGVFGGTEVRYEAHDQNGVRFSYTKFNNADGSTSYDISKLE